MCYPEVQNEADLLKVISIINVSQWYIAIVSQSRFHVHSSNWYGMWPGLISDYNRLVRLKNPVIFYSKFDLCDPKFRSKAKLIDLVHIRSHWRPYQRKKNSNNWKYTKKNPNFRQIAPIFDLTPPPEYLLSSRGCPSFRPLARMSNFSLNDSQQSRHCKIWTEFKLNNCFHKN